MRVSANYTYKNDKGKKMRASHDLDCSVSREMDHEVLEELLRHDIKEKTGRKVKKFTLISRDPEHIKRL